MPTPVFSTDRRGDPCIQFYEDGKLTVVAYRASNNAHGMKQAIEAMSRALETLQAKYEERYSDTKIDGEAKQDQDI